MMRHGLLLRGTGDGRFATVDMEQAGLAIEGQVRHIKSLRQAGGGRLIAVARNNDKLQILRPLRSGPAGHGGGAARPAPRSR
jgi:hypothetical protein